METQLTSLVFSLSIFSLTIFEKKRLDSLITPFTVTAWPFVIISIFTNFVLIYFKFPAISVRVHYFLFINLIIIWTIGWLFYYLLFEKSSGLTQNSFDDAFAQFSKYQKFILIFSWILILIFLSKVLPLLNQHGGWTYMGNQEYENTVITGLAAHLVQIMKVCFLLIIFNFRSSSLKLLNIVTLFALGIIIAMIQVKYHLIWLLIILFLFRNVLKKPKLQLNNFIKLSLIVFIILCIFWIFLTIAWGTFDASNMGVWEFVFGHLINYFVSAPMVLDIWLNFGDIKPQWTLLIVFLNFVNVLTGQPDMIRATYFVGHGFFETAPGMYSNVGTAFGVYYLIGGYFFSFFMSCIVGITSYFLYFRSLKTQNPILIYLLLIFLTLGILSFFVQYLTLLSLYEMSVIMIIFLLLMQGLNYVTKNE